MSEESKTPSEPEPGASPPRRKGLSPELRRFMGTPRPRNDPAPDQPRDEPPGEKEPKRDVRRQEHRAGPVPGAVATVRASAEETPEAHAPRGMLRPDEKAARIPEMQRAIVILGALLLLALTFYVGMKFPYLRYQWMSYRRAAKLEETPAAKFPGVSSDQLVKQALEAERAGRAQEAVEKLIAAKYKNPAHRGLLLRAGKIAYEQKNLTSADKFFEQSVAFGENMDLAQHYRGLIATKRKDLAAALRFFAAASEAEPFVSDYHYYMGETLRLDHRPREAGPHYEQAALLARGRGEAAVCRVKARFAELEAGNASRVREQVAAQKAAGAQSAEWLLTEAALLLREGEVDGALALLIRARDGTEPGIFNTCVADPYFVDAARKQPQLQEAVRLRE